MTSLPTTQPLLAQNNLPGLPGFSPGGGTDPESQPEQAGEEEADSLLPDEPLEWDESVGEVAQTIQDLWSSFLAHSPLLVTGLVLLFLTWLFSRLADFLARRLLSARRIRSSLRELFRKGLRVGIWFVGLLIVTVVVFPDVTPGKALAGLGLGSLALGFAFKDLVENFIAGVFILWRFPFDPGDYIRWSDVEGRVDDITLRMTLVRKTDGELVVIPNASLFKDPVWILTEEPFRRVTFIAGIAYGEDVDQGREVITRAVQGCKTVQQTKPIQIFAQEFADSSINFEVTWWTGSAPVDIRRSRDEVVAAVKRGLDEAGIEIPFPYRTLTFKEPLRTLRDEAPGEEAQPVEGSTEALPDAGARPEGKSTP
jgi:small-conductance mechanosensitive channel